MKHSERQHLKDNELALALARANTWFGARQESLTLVAIAVVLAVAAVAGYTAWQNRVDAAAREMLAEAMVVYETRVAPATPPAEGNATPPAPETPAGSTFATDRARLDAALPKFLAAADAHPGTDPGRTARYHAAAVLVELGRFDEAVAQYDRVAAEGGGLLAQMARLGKAEAQLRSAQYDAAITSFKDLSDRTDLGVPKEAMLLELARAYRLAGKPEDARKTLTQIVEQHADSPFASEAKTELEKIKS